MDFKPVLLWSDALVFPAGHRPDPVFSIACAGDPRPGCAGAGVSSRLGLVTFTVIMVYVGSPCWTPAFSQGLPRSREWTPTRSFTTTRSPAFWTRLLDGMGDRFERTTRHRLP